MMRLAAGFWRLAVRGTIKIVFRNLTVIKRLLAAGFWRLAVRGTI